MKLEMLKTVIANVEGKSVPFKPGQEVDLPEDAADNLVRGGYAQALAVVALEPVSEPEDAPPVEDSEPEPEAEDVPELVEEMAEPTNKRGNKNKNK